MPKKKNNLKLPACPECSQPLEEICETGTFRKDWAWNPEKGYYEGGRDKFADTQILCGHCGTPIPDKFFLEHLEPDA